MNPMNQDHLEKLHAGEAALANMFISISGLLGSGKTTLARALGEKMGLKVYEEPVIDNIYLADFYQDMKRYSFPLQVYLLNARFRQQQQIIWEGRGGVQDRTIYEDSVFARMLKDSGLMEERDFQTYVDLFTNMSNFMRKPNLIVHLDVSPEESLRRIKMRARDCETSVTLEYLQNLYDAYEKFIKDIARVIPVLRVDYSKFRTAEEMADMIVKEYSQMTNIRNVHWEDGRKADASKEGEKEVKKSADETQSKNVKGDASGVKLERAAAPTGVTNIVPEAVEF